MSVQRDRPDEEYPEKFVCRHRAGTPKTPPKNNPPPLSKSPKTSDIYPMTANTPVYLEFVRRTCLPWPGVTEKLCYGTPGFYVNKKLFARMKEDGETLVVQSVIREKWMLKDPQTYFITDHYRNYDYLLISLPGVPPDELTGLLQTAWYNRAPRRLQQQHDENNDE